MRQTPRPQKIILGRQFYARDTITVARALLGQIVELGPCSGRIVEVEAYLGNQGDLAAHSSRGITHRTRVIFGPPGHAYVYLIYGIHECLNIVAEPDGVPGCVLIRALEPLSGIELMRERRAAATKDRDLTNGPGKLTAALGITRRQHYGADLTTGPLLALAAPAIAAPDIVTTTRIGIRECQDWPLRFYIRNNPFVSHTVPGHV